MNRQRSCSTSHGAAESALELRQFCSFGWTQSTVSECALRALTTQHTCITAYFWNPRFVGCFLKDSVLDQGGRNDSVACSCCWASPELFEAVPIVWLDSSPAKGFGDITTEDWRVANQSRGIYRGWLCNPSGRTFLGAIRWKASRRQRRLLLCSAGSVMKMNILQVSSRPALAVEVCR